MDRSETLSFRWRHLPHWMVDDRPYFVTMRLKGSLPRTVAERLRKERETLVQAKASEGQLLDCHRLQFATIEAILDAAGDESCYLRRPEVALIVLGSFGWLRKHRSWTIFAATIMPNHVHVLTQNMEGRNGLLSEDLGDLKGYTAKKANNLLRRTGHFWQDENFDHWIRSEGEFEAARRYIVNNPVKAGLVRLWSDWPFTRVL